MKRATARLVLHSLPALAAGALLPSAADAAAAVITFSGLNNGVNTATDPDNTSTGTAIPTTYQPLLNAYPAPGGGTDGANAGITITYVNSFVAAKVSNSGVNEHTHLVTPADTANVNLYDNGANPITLTFSQPVTIPSFYYSFFGAGTYSGTFSAFTTAADTTPVATFNFGPFTETAGYNWREETRFGTTPMQKVTFSRSAQYLQIDDITVNPVVVPEPGTAAAVALAAGGLLMGRRRHRR